MGCGQSKIGIYQRKSKNKKNGSKRSAEDGENDEETEEAEDIINSEIKKTGEGEKEEEVEEGDSITSKIKQMAQQQTGGAVLAQGDISSSQLDFFKMLDEKIESGPDYEDSDEEEQKARMANLMQEWKAACMARQQKKNEEDETWNSPARVAKQYQEDYENYSGRRINTVDTQRFPTGYSPCPPISTISVHLQNSFKYNAPTYVEAARGQPRIPVIGNYNPFPPTPLEPYNHFEEPSGHSISTNEPSNPLRTNYSQIILRQSSINTQLQHYTENQRLYSENMRQFSDFSRPYQDQRAYPTPRTMSNVNILHEHRIYGADRFYQIYQDGPRQPEDSQRTMVDVQRPYYNPQRQENIRLPFDNQRLYHERLKEKQRQYAGHIEGPKTPNPFQRPPSMTQRSIQEPSRMYKDLDNGDHGYQRQIFGEPSQEGAGVRVHNVSIGRSLSTDAQYVACPPPPREVIPLQGAPGPPQGSPRPLVARGLQTNFHRLPANSAVHYRKPQDEEGRSYDELLCLSSKAKFLTRLAQK